ncbi:MAG: hypothetical protein ABIJ26_04285, partial [Candidatus Margulisiibacteriota bacterium]
SIKSYPIPAGVAVNSPNPFDPSKERTKIIYNLEEETDIKFYLFTTTAELVWKREFVAGSEGAKSGENVVEWNGRTDFGEIASNGVYLLKVIDKRSGKVKARGKIATLWQ